MKPKFTGRRIDKDEWVDGYYFVSPLTDENSGAPTEAGWFFLTGEKRHCISTEEGVVYVVEEKSVHFFGDADSEITNNKLTTKN